MDGHEYEYVVADYLREKGYTDVEVTRGSGDFGIDVIACRDGHKYAVQCKYYSNPVSQPAVREAVAGMAYYNCDKAMVVTNNCFTSAAKELAEVNGVELVEYVECENTPTHACTSSNDVGERESPILKFIKKFKLLFIVIAVFYLFYLFVMLTFTYGTNGVASFENQKNFWLSIFIPLLVVAIIFLFFGRTKKIYFVVLDKEDRFMTQRLSGGDNKNLDISDITGLPHKMTINKKNYDIDNLDDINTFPIVFHPFVVNGTKYYFNDYFRLYAKACKEKGHKDLSKALKKRANDFELNKYYGAKFRKVSKTIIYAPGLKVDRKSNGTLYVESKTTIFDDRKTRSTYEEQERHPIQQSYNVESNYPQVDTDKVANGIQATQDERLILETVVLQKRIPSISMMQMVSGRDYVHIKNVFNRLVENGFVDGDSRQWTVRACK